jgi:hypothetical protein
MEFWGDWDMLQNKWNAPKHKNNIETVRTDSLDTRSLDTRWFKYDRDWFVQTYTQISPGHIWTTLYYQVRPKKFLEYWNRAPEYKVLDIIQ